MRQGSSLSCVTRGALVMVLATAGVLTVLRSAAMPVPHTISLVLPVPENVRVRHMTQEALAAGYVAAFGLKPAAARQYADWIQHAAEQHDLSPALLSAVVMTESSFRADARSVVGAVGPAQVRPVFWEDECLVDLEDPADNIWCAGRILSLYKAWCDDDLQCALQAYNVGPSNLGRPALEAARLRYLSKINRHHNVLMLAMQ